MNKILHLSMGGTITGNENDYPQIEALSHFFTNAVDIGMYFKKSMKIKEEYLRREICNKDSRDVTSGDRQILLYEIERAHKEGINNFLITHGTFTMPETGVYLQENLEKELIEDVSVVITGSMYPMNLIGGDGLLNLGASISSLLNIKESLGVVINMHGKNWNPRKIHKNADELIFEGT